MVFSFETEKIKQKKGATFPGGKSHLRTERDYRELREKCQAHPKRESGHAGKARIVLSRAQDGHACQRPQAEQSHQNLPVCAARPGI